MHHVIQKQYLDVAVNGEESAGFKVQRAVAAFCSNELPHMLEHLLGRFAPTNGVLSIERLEIDAGSIDWAHLERDLPAQVEKAIEDALRAQYPLPREQGAGVNRGPLASDVVFKTQAQSVWETFLYFLETGRLPWNASLPQEKTLETLLREHWLSPDSNGALLSQKRAEWIPKIKEPNAQKRMAAQFSEAFLGDWLRWMAPPLWEAVQQVLPIIQVLSKSGSPVFWEKMVWTAVFSYLSNRSDTQQPPAWDALLGTMGTALSRQQTQLLDEHIPPGAREILSTLLAETQRQMPTKIAALRAHLSASGAADQRAQALLLLLPANDQPAPQPMLDAALPPVAQGTEIYVQNAGLVLLHPFLPQFLGALGAAEEDSMVNPDQALYLLHFLATGSETAAEYDLTFGKLLCGLPLEQPVEMGPGLTAEEKAEALNLLQTVVRYWDVLKDTSPDGLRGAYLHRPGKLSATQDGAWLLQVEPQPQDILLDQLPWGIGMVQLPWMKNMLRVEWN